MGLNLPDGVGPQKPLESVVLGDELLELFSMPPREKTALTLSAGDLRRFEGGQAQIMNDNEGYNYICRVKDIRFEPADGDDRNLAFSALWMVKHEGGGWQTIPPLPYASSACTMVISERNGVMLSLYNPISFELVVLVAPGHEMLSEAEALGTAA